jgi:hypothetical protein
MFQQCGNRRKHKYHKEKDTNCVEASREVGLEVEREETEYMSYLATRVQDRIMIY